MKQKVTHEQLTAMRGDLEAHGVVTNELTATEIVKLHSKYCASKPKKTLTPYQAAKKQMKRTTGIRGFFYKQAINAVDLAKDIKTRMNEIEDDLEVEVVESF